MTRGKTPEWADTPYAQWIRSRVEELDWQKQDLAAALSRESSGRLSKAGASGLVGRVTKRGTEPAPINRRLIAAVLGPEPTVLLGGAEGEVVRLAREIRRLTDRVEALERRSPPVEHSGRAASR